MLEVLVHFQSDDHSLSQQQTNKNKIFMDVKPITSFANTKSVPTKDVRLTDHRLSETKVPASRTTPLESMHISGRPLVKARKQSRSLAAKVAGSPAELPYFLTNKEPEQQEPAGASRTAVRKVDNYHGMSVTPPPWSLHKQEMDSGSPLSSPPWSLLNRQEMDSGSPLPIKKERPKLDSLKYATTTSANTPLASSNVHDVHRPLPLKTEPFSSVRSYLPGTPPPLSLSPTTAPLPQLIPAFSSTTDEPPNEPPKFFGYPQQTQNLFVKQEEDLLCEDFEDLDTGSSMPKTSSTSIRSSNSFRAPDGVSITPEEALVSYDGHHWGLLSCIHHNLCSF